MIKIKYGAPSGRYLPAESSPEHLTVDSLRASRMSTPARLSPETLINFADNGVPAAVFRIRPAGWPTPGTGIRQITALGSPAG